jgi:hypothetical protein
MYTGSTETYTMFPHRMKKRSILNQTRREHVQSLIVLALASSAPGILLAQDGDESFTPSQTSRLSSAEALQMLAVARALFPHKILSDRYYWIIVSNVDDASSDPATASLVKEGLETLGAGFSQLDPAARERALAAIEDSDFFAFVQSKTVNGLYYNPEIWPLFGFEGSSVEHGGYLYRGFDDIDWLPQDLEQNP